MSSTKDHLHVCQADDPNRVCLECGEASPTPQATKPVDELRAEILTEFKQVHKLAPADYTENCTNVVMRIIENHTKALLTEARIEEATELRREFRRKSWEPYDTDKIFNTRLAQLKNERSNK